MKSSSITKHLIKTPYKIVQMYALSFREISWVAIFVAPITLMSHHQSILASVLILAVTIILITFFHMLYVYCKLCFECKRDQTYRSQILKSDKYSFKEALKNKSGIH